MPLPLTLEGLRRAWAEVWRPAALVAALMIVLAPRAGLLGLAGAGIAVVVWAGDYPDRARELARYTAGFVAFAALRNLADDAGATIQYDYVIAWERALFGEVPAITLQRAMMTPGRWGPLDYAVVTVYLSYFILPPTVLVLLWRFWPRRLRPYVSGTLALFGASMVVHLLVPTAPPWYAAGHGHLPAVHQLVRMMFGEVAPATYHYGVGLSGNAVAAMPSVHLGVTGLMACALWPTSLRLVSLAYIGLMGFAIVYAGEHYVVDGLAGLALALPAWAWACHRAAS